MTYDEWLRDCLAIAAREKLTAAELDRMLSMHRDRPAASPTQQKDRLMTQDEKMLVSVPDRAAALRVGKAILEAHGAWETENVMHGGQAPWCEQHCILLGQAAMLEALSAAPVQPAAVEGAGEPVRWGLKDQKGQVLALTYASEDEALRMGRRCPTVTLTPFALYAHPSTPADADDIRNIVQQLIIDVLSDGQRGDAPAGLARRDPAVDQILSRVTPAADDALRVAVEKALEPFAAMASVGDQRPKDDAVWAGQDGRRITYGDFRRAAEALAALKSTAALKAGGVK